MQERIAGAGKARIKELDNGVDQFVPKPFVFSLAPPSHRAIPDKMAATVAASAASSSGVITT
jgi:hypothetical protein